MRGEYFLFGKDADGSIYVFHQIGKVILFNIRDNEWENPIMIAEDFEAFINDCLLGKRYGEFMNPENSKFYLFLESQGWV